MNIEVLQIFGVCSGEFNMQNKDSVYENSVTMSEMNGPVQSATTKER